MYNVAQYKKISIDIVSLCLVDVNKHLLVFVVPFLTLQVCVRMRVAHRARLLTSQCAPSVCTLPRTATHHILCMCITQCALVIVQSGIADRAARPSPSPLSVKQCQ